MPRPGTLPGQPVLPAAAASAYGGGGVPAAAPVHSASDAVAALRASARALVQPSLASGGAVQAGASGVVQLCGDLLQGDRVVGSARVP